MVKTVLTEAVEAALHATPPLTAAVTDSLLPQPPADSDRWVGIDVAQAHLEVATWPSRERRRVSRDEAGLTDLIGGLQARPPTLIVLEATGGLEIPVVAALVEAQ